MKLNQLREEDMKGALEEHKNGTDFSLRQLARAWHVPVATLFKRIKKGACIYEHRSGTNTVLSCSQKSELVALTKTLSNRGFPLSCKDIRNISIIIT